MGNTLERLKTLVVLIFTVLSLCYSPLSQALFVSPAKDPLPIIEETFPQATSISDKQGPPTA